MVSKDEKGNSNSSSFDLLSCTAVSSHPFCPYCCASQMGARGTGGHGLQLLRADKGQAAPKPAPSVPAPKPMPVVPSSSSGHPGGKGNVDSGRWLDATALREAAVPSVGKAAPTAAAAAAPLPPPKRKRAALQDVNNSRQQEQQPGLEGKAKGEQPLSGGEMPACFIVYDTCLLPLADKKKAKAQPLTIPIEVGALTNPMSNE